MAKVTVLGAGGWGMALAIAAHKNGNKVSVWSPFTEEIELLTEKRSNERLLKGVVLPEDISLTTDISVAENSDITILATPSVAIRETAKRLKELHNFGIAVNVAKGFENTTLLRLSEVIAEELPQSPIVVLTGPSHAEEVARNLPTSIAAVSKNASAAKTVQEILSSSTMRIYTNNDVIGAELGGALKNVIAVTVGFCEGLGFGDNTRAALITRGLAEMKRLGVKMGAEEITFAGLTGIGDLVVTCMSKHSRNNRFGNLVGSGMAIDKALKEVGTVEGYYAAKIAYEISLKYNIDMPIIRECYNVLYENKTPLQVVEDLMCRPLGSE